MKANKEKEAAAKRERQKSTSSAGGLDTVTDEGADNMEVPKDRTQLANMRVIRRNLVYAVGLPPSVASEDQLRKPEYFGQYGKISKIVLNRMQATAGDSRRASASAYVTFVHKEDTLACILALDGFYLENRNIRASYGTSKYCSAFIKNVRCNNPDCTYLHEMGAAEDTFTKQEIQAGYVTSGRDVLARQQQIVAEQLRAGATGGMPRKRIGGGGPSGTGKSSSNPLFPPPEYDEPAKVPPPLIPQPGGVARATTTSAVPSLNPATIAAKLGRSSSQGGGRSPPLGPVVAATTPQRKGNSIAAATAASVVAGVHSVSSKPETTESRSVLMPLTPLKRTAKAGTKAGTSAPAADEKLAPVRTGRKPNGVRAIGPAPTPASGVSSIGGDVIGPPQTARTAAIGVRGGDPMAPMDSLAVGADQQLLSSSSLLGGEIFTGQLPNGSKSAIGSGKDKRSLNPTQGGSVIGAPLAGGVLWNSGHSAPGPAGGGLIGSQLSSQTANSSSALASILGINLPTGSGSLQESLWSTPGSHEPSPISSLNGSNLGGRAVNGAGAGNGGSSLIGGVPIGGGAGGMPMNSGGGALIGGGGHGGGFNGLNGPGTIGSNNNGDSKTDLALLQSLLPGVQVTSRTEALSFNNGGWNAPRGALGPGALGGETIGGWGGGMHTAPGSSVGAIGQNGGPQRQGPGIW